MRRKYVLISVLIAVLSIVTTSTAQADTYRSRTDRWEFTVQMRYLDGQTISFDGGSSFDVNSDVGWGFGFGYNFNEHLALNFDVGWSSPSYDATIVSADTPPLADQRASGELSTSSLHLNLLYNFIAGPITPFVTAGIGSTFVDSNIAYGPPSNSCWYDPYWGYYCGYYQPTYSENRFSYNASLGVRWDLARDSFLRASIGSYWIDMKNSGSQNFTSGRLEVGFMF
jgi:opacity protein-like surface antigen